MDAKKAYLIAAVMIIQTALLWTSVQGQDPKFLLISDFNRQDSYGYSWERGRDPDRIIRRAYEDILRREPDVESLRYYRNRMIDDGWTETDLREDLRRSGDYLRGSRMSRQEAERIVRDSYQEVLRREPDPGSRVWVDKVLREGWTQQDVIRELRKSDEYRKLQGSGMNHKEAEQIVRRAYLAVLEREPDPGSRPWVDKVLNERWTVEDVARALRDSDEYRRKHR